MQKNDICLFHVGMKQIGKTKLDKPGGPAPSRPKQTKDKSNRVDFIADAMYLERFGHGHQHPAVA